MKCIDDSITDLHLGIDGLRFEPNNVQHLPHSECWFSKKILSSDGPLISDFVTHEQEFRYGTYGIHIGQDDRLTFFGDNGKNIIAEFVDCREDSSLLHQHVKISFSPSPYRKLIIPRGVAHTFDNLEHIVTRDEPVWHADINNPHWNFDNDLVSVDREDNIQDFPVVKVNRFRLPDEAHRLQSRLSQKLLEKPSAYLARYRMKIGGVEQYISFEPTFWSDDQGEVEALTSTVDVPGIRLFRARYALTGPRSWTLVPTTDACIADVLEFPRGTTEDTPLRLHSRTTKYYTILCPQGVNIEIFAIDCRAGSRTCGESFSIKTISDPRVVIEIEHGIAYVIKSQNKLYMRCEASIFVDANEPREDLPMFNNDIMDYTSLSSVGSLEVPTLRCPGEILYKIGKQELSAMS